MSLRPLVVTITLVRGREDNAYYFEIEIVLDDGRIISQIMKANKTIQLDFTSDCEVEA